MRFRMMLATVDLPEPDSPTSAVVVPLRIPKLTSSTAVRVLSLPLAPRTSKTLVRCSTRRISSVALDPRLAPRSSSSVTWMPRAWADSMRREAREGAALTRRWVYGWRGSWSTSRLGPDSTTRPRCMTTMCSALSAASPRSWVMKSIAVPSSRTRVWRWSRMRRWTVTSRALVGSSAMSRSGRAARPMAMRARWRMPPENSWGYCLARREASGRPACSSRRATCSSTSMRPPVEVAAFWAPSACPVRPACPACSACSAMRWARRSSATPARPLARSASLTWKPMDHTGLRLDMGS